MKATTSRVWRRLPLLLTALLALASGVAAGLLRLGAWPALPPAQALVNAAVAHGALMVCGFFGLVISLERAVALGASLPGRRWAWLAPVAAGAGTVLLLSGAAVAAAWAWSLSALVLFMATARIWMRQPEPFVGVLALGAASSCVGNVLVLQAAPLASIVPWWLAFLVFTVAGERLELSRLAPRAPGAMAGFWVNTAALTTTLLLQLPDDPVRTLGAHGFGAGLLSMAVWLGRHDLARRTVRQRGLVRFIACSLLAGYGWLGVGGLLIMFNGLQPATAAWDAALHGILLGFVFSMVFGHAPIILPAVLRVDVGYSRGLYLPLAMLHVSVAGRVLGSLLEVPVLRQGSAWASAAALLLFVATILTRVRGRGTRRGTDAKRPPSLRLIKTR
jgi:hypothetical protein